MYDDPGKLAEAVMVFRPNGGSNIRTNLGSEYHVLVDVVGAKDKRKDALNAVQRIVDYVQANPMADECVGYIQNMGAIPAPVLTEEGRIVFRLQFACTYGE
nr:MAG TPA: tail completion protein [Caudoviricetes sp.]